jgi:hypothetical protein
MEKMTLEETRELIAWTCDDIKKMLLDKNSDYGNAALEPLRIHSKADPIEQIKVRLDDKLSRMINEGPKNFKEDTLKDYIGYLIFLLIAQRISTKKVLATVAASVKSDAALDANEQLGFISRPEKMEMLHGSNRHESDPAQGANLVHYGE